jgi:hypothetical protein
MATNPVPQPPDTSDLPVSSNLASAISDQGAGLSALAIPSEAPPSSGQPSGNLQAAISGPASYPPSPDQGGPTPTPSDVSNPPQQAVAPQAPLQGLGGRLRGVLMGLATGGIGGAVEGAIAPNLARTHFQQAEELRQARVDTAQSRAQFESAQAALTHVQALHAANRADLLDEESRLTVAQKAADYESYLQNNFGILPTLQISGNGQDTHDQANGALNTLAGQNGGVIPPVFANIQPHGGNKSTFDISVFAPSQQTLASNPAGFRKIVDTARTVQGLPPIDDLSWNSGQGKGYQGQRMLAQDAMQFLSTIQSFTEQNLPAMLAQRKQQLAGYQNHTDLSGKPDADPATVSALSQSVDFLQKAYDDLTESKAKAQATTTAIETPAKTAQEVAIKKATLPFDLAKTKAEEAIKDGDPNAAAQLLVNGDVAPSQIISSRKPAFAQQAFSAAKQLDPNWNSQAAEGYYKTASSPTNVQFFGSAKSLTDQNGTLDQLQTAYNRLPNGRIPALNKISDWTAAASGSGATAAFAQTALGVADDYAKVMGGGQGSDTSRQEVLDSFARSHSPQAMSGAIGAARQAVDSQMSSRIGQNPVMRRMYGSGLLIHVTDPRGNDQVFRTQAAADAYKKAAGIQ